ncbi:hypothetical protein [Streptomyces sp. NPDC051452]|uniref:hypothetical protein n=1 Tax=Streptomyces sp. NPDC051452 TaxID=3365654 RepID=UPI0037A484F3
MTVEPCRLKILGEVEDLVCRGAAGFEVALLDVGRCGSGEEQTSGAVVRRVECLPGLREAGDGAAGVAEVQVAAASLSVDLALVDPVQPLAVVL